MGFMNLDQFRRMILSNSALQEQSGIDHSLVDIWVNLAYFEVTGAVEFEALKKCANLNTIVGASEYNLPISFVGMVGVADRTSGSKLLKTSLPNMQRMGYASSGSPRYWARTGSGVKLWPTPDRVYGLHAFYIAEPTKLVSDTDKTVLPATWDQSILLLALRNALVNFNQFEAADKVFTGAMANMRSRLTDADFSEPNEGPLFVARSFDELFRRDG